MKPDKIVFFVKASGLRVAVPARNVAAMVENPDGDVCVTLKRGNAAIVVKGDLTKLATDVEECL